MTGESSRMRFGVVAIVAISLFAALFARLWYLQVMNSSAYSQVAVARAERVILVPPPRGRILDRNGHVLVDNTPTKVVAVDRQALAKVKDSDAVLSRLAGLLNRYQHPRTPFTLTGIKRVLAVNRVGPYDPVPLSDNIDDRLLVYLTENSQDFPGVVAETQLLRQYHYGDVAAQLLGYVGPISDTQYRASLHTSHPYQKDDQVGRAGVEQSFEKYLRGTPGRDVVEVDPTGRIVRTVSETPPKAGNDVYLSIDVNAQVTAERQLAAEMANARTQIGTLGYPPAPAGATILLDPRNGQVLAMATNPTYDPGIFVPSISEANWRAINTGKYYSALNRAVSQTYAPGSTFKLVTALAALKAGEVTPEQYVDDAGSYTPQNCSGSCPAVHNAGFESLGPVNLTSAITKSSDVYFFRLGDILWSNRARDGDTAIQDMAAQFGFGRPTGIELPNEAWGLVPTPALEARRHEQNPTAFPYGTWYTGNNMNLAIGQGDLTVTPLQLANAYAQFANGGVRYKPTLLFKVTKPYSHVVVARSQPKVVGRLAIDPAWHAAMLAGFDGVTKPGGTAAGKFDDIDQTIFDVAGKTGTAQTCNNCWDNAFFVGFAPAAQASYVGVAMVEQAGFGADSAAPVVNDLFAPLASGHGFPPVAPTIPYLAPPLTTTTTSTSTTSTVPGTGYGYGTGTGYGGTGSGGGTPTTTYGGGTGYGTDTTTPGYGTGTTVPGYGTAN